MNKILSFVRLDYITVKPYLTLKNLFIFIAVALVMTISSGDSASSIGILMMYAVLFSSNSFAVGEKNGIDALYVTLSINRHTVVLGRYLFTLIVDACAGLIAYVISFILMTVLKQDFNALESFIAVLVMFLIYSVLQAIQLPIYFKLGYAKAKFAVYLPLLGLPLAILAFSNLLKDTFSLKQITDFLEWFANNPLITVLLIKILWLAIMFVSYRISLSYYNKREF